MGEDGGLLQQICKIGLVEIVRSAAGLDIKKERNENVTKLLSMSSKRGVGILADLMN